MNFLPVIYAVLTCLVLPAGLILFLCIKHPGLLSRVGMGAAVYIILELILKLPLLASITSNAALLGVFDQYPILYALLLGAIEALFFTFITYVFFRYFFGFRDTNLDAFAYGIGFGSAQAIIMVGLPASSRLMAGQGDLTGVSIALAATEQISMLLLFLSLSLMLMQAVQKKSKGLLAAGAGLLFLVYFLSYTALSILNVPGLLYEIILLACMLVLARKYFALLPFACPVKKRQKKN